MGTVGRYVAANVRRLRQTNGWALSALEARLEGNGQRIPVPLLSRIERGERGVDADELTALADVFGVTAAVLMTDPEVAEHEDAVREIQEMWSQIKSVEGRLKGLARETEWAQSDLAEAQAALDSAIEDPIKRKVYEDIVSRNPEHVVEAFDVERMQALQAQHIANARVTAAKRRK